MQKMAVPLLLVVSSLLLQHVTADAPVDTVEEPPEDERTPPPPPPGADMVACRVWLTDGTPGAWEHADHEVVRFGGASEIEKYFAANPSKMCMYVHIVSGKSPPKGWLYEVMGALRGHVHLEAIVDDLDSTNTCKDFSSAKAVNFIERERCRLRRDEYLRCRCISKRHVRKNLACVPGSHPMYLDPSPLANHTMRCIARFTYKARHLDTRVATYTPARPYPSDPTTATAAVLAYVNTKNVLKGTAEVFKTWAPFFLRPQNISLFIFRETTRVTLDEVVAAFDLVPAEGDSYKARGTPSPPIYLSTTRETYPTNLSKWDLYKVRPRCGCPPICLPVTKRSPDGFIISGLRYVQGTSVYTWELLQDTRLLNFDFVIKVDWDIRFFRPVRPKIVEQIVEAKAFGFHTGFANNGAGCSRDTQKAMDLFAVTKGVRARSAGDWLYENEALTWHSSVFGVWTGFLFSKEYRELVDYLRNGPLGMSWFRYRWTDQTVWPKVIGFFHTNMDSVLLDLRWLRWHPSLPRPKSAFYHRKTRRPDSEICCGKCEENPDRACYKNIGGTTKSWWCPSLPSSSIQKRLNLEMCER
eukprot:Sspe_Gene.11037::Locus_3718_Transcript_1_1_Confidence_1.000_Length_1921::g.11037::m.11037